MSPGLEILLKKKKEKKLLLVLCGFPIMHSDPTYLPIPSICPLPLYPLPVIKTKFKRKTIKQAKQTKQKQTQKFQKQRRNLSWELQCGNDDTHTVYPLVSFSETFR